MECVTVPTGAAHRSGRESGYSSWSCEPTHMIRKLNSGQYRLYSRKVDPRTKRRRNLGTFSTRAAAEKHERAVQYFKRK
jgi:hypothetical protein